MRDGDGEERKQNVRDGRQVVVEGQSTQDGRAPPGKPSVIQGRLELMMGGVEGRWIEDRDRVGDERIVGWPTRQHRPPGEVIPERVERKVGGAFKNQRGEEDRHRKKDQENRTQRREVPRELPRELPRKVACAVAAGVGEVVACVLGGHGAVAVAAQRGRPQADCLPECRSRAGTQAACTGQAGENTEPTLLLVCS